MKIEKRELFGMFKPAKNELGYITCIIKREYKDDFIKLGFVDNVEKLEKPKQKRVKSNEDQQRLVS
jgi:hypothetical protein